MPRPKPVNTTRGYDYVHSRVDDYFRLVYSEILPREKATNCAAFLLRVAAYFTDHGIPLMNET